MIVSGNREMRMPSGALQRVAEAVLCRAGSEPGEARVVAEHLVRANLAGHDSHGVGMIPYYVRFVGEGLLHPNTPARLLADEGPILRFEGGRGYGQRVAREAIAAGIERCRALGVSVVTLRHAHHVGRVGTYGEQAAEGGLVSLHWVNVQDHPPLMAPFRGGDARFGTNPVCVTIPRPGREGPILLDMATSRIALGKVRLLMNKGELVPEGHLVDEEGRPTRDPKVMFRQDRRGALLPVGEHKGYGLALVAELLAGVLSGGGTIQPAIPRKGAIVNNLFSVLIDPGRFGDPEWMQAEIDAMVAYAKASPPAQPAEPVLVAGEPERLAAAERQRHGIPVDAVTWEEILEAGERVGLGRGEALALAGLDSEKG